MSTSDLLLEIGCEELPASFVDGALRALPTLTTKRLAELRLEHGAIRALGTPRRLALIVEGVAAQQPDLEEEVTGPPVKAAFKDGKPTKAAEAFANKLGVAVDELKRVETAKGEYLAGTRREKGRPARDLLGTALGELITQIPFRKSMRWASYDLAFGRPIQWLVALFGDAVLPLSLAGLTAGRVTRGHRFLSSEPAELQSPAGYVDVLRKAHVVVDPEERKQQMVAALHKAAAGLDGVLIEDDFLVEENLSLVEECHVIAGGFDKAFLDLPERVILEVAKGHQRYFGVRGKDGKLLPSYLSVVNTANQPETIRRGSDRVMRARLADAQFFYREDLKLPLENRRDKLEGIVFQKRLGTVGAKVRRMEALVRRMGALVSDEAAVRSAEKAAGLAKCDLVSLMVGEFPELEGEMGAAYARKQGVDGAVADAIAEHYQPRGANDEPPASLAGALVSLADRLDTLVGCFAIGLTPTGAADPYALRRACLGILRTLSAHHIDVSVSDLVGFAYDGYEDVKLDLGRDEAVQKVTDFAVERLRGLLADVAPADVVGAVLPVAGRRPIDAKRRAEALAHMDAAVRAQVGEVFKRAHNIAAKAPTGEPDELPDSAHAAEKAVDAAYRKLRVDIDKHAGNDDYAAALKQIGELRPLLAQYFDDILVMDPDETVRNRRLRLMRGISETCSSIARFELLAPAS